MNSEADIIESLNAIGYDGKVLSEDILRETIDAGPKSEHFRELVTWLAFEIHVLRSTDEKVGRDTDFNEFMLEISAFLKELTCPYSEFVAGPLTSRFQSKDSRILLMSFLITELMALKMCAKLKPQKSTYIISVDESSTARALESITKELNLGKPPENISPKILFDKIANKVDEVLKKTPAKRLSQPLFKCTKPLTDAQWKKLEKLHKELDQEYNMRRQMLLTRLEVTIQSFQWSEKLRGRGDEIVNRYQKKKGILDELLCGDSNTDIPALLAARLDLAIIEKTSSANVRKNTASKIQKHVIGRVPDRGGRAYEHAPPPPEMPSWQQNRSAGGGQGGRGGGGFNRGSGRGGRGGGGGGNQGGQGNWSQQQKGGSQGNWSQPQHFSGNANAGSFNQQQPFEQRQQYDDRDRQWSGNAGNRVQGGWSQRGNDNMYNQRNTEVGSGGYNNQGNYGGQQQSQGYNKSQQDWVRGGSNFNSKGRSNYSRGGGNRR